MTAQHGGLKRLMYKLLMFIIFVSGIPNGTAAQETVYMQSAPGKAANKKTEVKNINDVVLNESFVNLSILEVFTKIEDATDFRFSYDDNDLNKDIRITMDAEGKSVADILYRLSNQTYLSFHQLNNDIIARLQATSTESKSTQAQDITVSGTVVDQDGVSLPGVNIVVKGTAIGTVTDGNGNFTLSVPAGRNTLIVSYVGYITQEVDIDNRTNINIQIFEDIRTLDEYVVIGYQTVKKQDLTGSVSVIDTKQLAEISTNTVVESLQGLAPGVTVRNGGKPGQMGDIQIRGIGSFRDKNPLYIIDGMYADPNSTINTNDIESIQILKDGSAAAIYGSRAANGVVIITTQKGKEGPAKISFSAKYGIQQIPRTWDVMNNYLIALSWFENEGVLIGNDFERASLRINTSGKKGRFFFGENMVMTRTIDDAPASGNAFYDLPQLLPVIPVQDDKLRNAAANNPGGWGYGTPSAPTYAWNYIAINELHRNKSTFAKIVGNGFAGFEFTDYLQYKFNAGVEASFDRTKTIRKDGN